MLFVPNASVSPNKQDIISKYQKRTNEIYFQLYQQIKWKLFSILFAFKLFWGIYIYTSKYIAVLLFLNTAGKHIYAELA